MSPIADTDSRLCDVVACLSCGRTRVATRTRTSITPTACLGCGYVGWRPARAADPPAADGQTLALALRRLAAHPSS